jgi:hypothetical protein
MIFLELRVAGFIVLFKVLQIPHLRPRAYAGISKRQKTVNRAYGGNRCANCVRERYRTSPSRHDSNRCSRLSRAFLFAILEGFLI